MATVPHSQAELALSFGLVSVPVNLYSATDESEKIAFNWIHRDCGSRVEQRLYCKAENIPVERSDLVKGREIGRDQYVLFETDEIKMLEEQGTQTVDIVSFVPWHTIDPVFYSKAYYLAPTKRGVRPYKLLDTALRQTGRVALAEWAWHGKSYTAQIRPGPGGVLVLQQLYYLEEVRNPDVLNIPDEEVKPAELDLAVMLIEQGAAEEFHPERFHNYFKERLDAATAAKVAGQAIRVPEERHATQLIDLEEILRQSLKPPPEQAVHKPGKRVTGRSTKHH